MTEHVRTSYRSHRKATWAVVLGLVVVVAAVVIPLATAADKTYTMSVNPTSMCAPATDGEASTVVTLKNTGSPQTAGSAEVYFPAGSVHGVDLPWQVRTGTSPSSGGTKDIVYLDNMNMAPNQTKTITVRFKKTANFSTSIIAVLKQANRFNDSGGGANLFTVTGGYPTLRVVQCVTVAGRVYHDRNLDTTYTTGTGAFLNSDVPKEWTVKLFGKDVGAPESSYALVTQTTSGGPSSQDPGKYTFTQVPGLRDYKICVLAAGADTSSMWATQVPTGNTECAAISTGGPLSAANRLPNLSQNQLTQDFQVVPVVGPFGQGDSSTVGAYEVIAGTNSGQKPDDFYVQDTWVDQNGATNFRFSPIGGTCTQNCSQKIYLLERLTADIELSKLSGQQATLRYDDMAPFLDSQLKLMPYCNIDPRSSPTPPFTLATTGVLPGTDTSCIVTGQQTVVAGSKVTAVYQVYTAYDGGRQIG
jgi:hypothetical protein